MKAVPDGVAVGAPSTQKYTRREIKTKPSRRSWTKLLYREEMMESTTKKCRTVRRMMSCEAAIVPQKLGVIHRWARGRSQKLDKLPDRLAR